MGFKDFCKSQENEKKDVDYEQNTKRVEKLYDEYKDKSEDELMSELINNVAKQKQDGTFDYNNIQNMLEKLSPFLTPEQNLKVKELLKKIK